MNTNDLKPWQIEKMIMPIQRSLRYLSTLLDRMNHVGFTPKEELYQRVQVAQSDMQALFMTLHYLSCGHGVGKPPKNDKPPHARRNDQPG